MTLVAVIGAGPAGLAAAETALKTGAQIVLIDMNDSPGGQYQRQLPDDYRAANPERIHHHWAAYRGMRDTVLTHPRSEWLANTVVFNLEPHPGGVPRLHVTSGPIDSSTRRRRVIEPDALVLATGAHDRVVPFPGWTLPGVYTAGAAQTLARTERVAVGRRVVVSGTGPFLLPVAKSLTDVGADVVGVLEINAASTVVRGWLDRPHRLAAHSGKLADLGHYGWHHLRRRIPFRTGRAVIAALGDDRVEAVVTARLDSGWVPVAGSERIVAVDAVCVGHGFTPSLELALTAGCRQTTTSAGTFVAVDDTQLTSVPGVYAAGEITGIGGADCADIEGRVAGFAAAGGRHLPVRLARRLTAAREFVTRLHRAHPVRDGWRSWLDDDTIVCRCESTTFGRLLSAYEIDLSLRATRLSTRAGLGPCQGRFCAANVDALCGEAAQSDRRQADGTPAAGAQNRPIAQPVRLGEIAARLDD
ncbi:MAG TPA: FAD-dependent oxidoreductase [Mycobacterium sp.]|nr:FAD-dependent oxidoreductase [Mycobacterium sp.]